MEKHILALDLGRGSLGLAVSRSGMFVTLLPEIRFHMDRYEELLAPLDRVVKEEDILLFVLGYPTYPSGDPCAMTENVLAFQKKLEALYPNIPVRLVDERYSTKEASELLHANGKNARRQRENIDSAASGVILTRYLESIGQA